MRFYAVKDSCGICAAVVGNERGTQLEANVIHRFGAGAVTLQPLYERGVLLGGSAVNNDSNSMSSNNNALDVGIKARRRFRLP